MGVDYSANYGIGVQIPDNWIDNKLEDEDSCIDSMLADVFKDSPCKYFGVGSASYDGGRDDYFVVIPDPFSNGIEGLIKKIEDFELFLNKKGIEFKKVDLVGGLLIW